LTRYVRFQELRENPSEVLLPIFGKATNQGSEIHRGKIQNAPQKDRRKLNGALGQGIYGSERVKIVSRIISRME
jgi:hypothetical protein